MMRVFLIALAGLAALILTPRTVLAEEITTEVPANDPADATADQIARNWNYDAETIARCAQRIALRLHFQEDGTVIKIDELSDLTNEYCRAASQSMRGAVLITKKFAFSGKAPESLLLVLNPTTE
jgi:hypothetical protein